MCTNHHEDSSGQTLPAFPSADTPEAAVAWIVRQLTERKVGGVRHYHH